MSLLRTAALRAASRTARSSVAPIRAFSSSSSSSAQAQSDKDPQLGDYPEMPFVSLQTRKYSPKWWDPQEKRNFGETPHEQDDILSVWAPDVHPTSGTSAVRQFLVAIGVVCLFGATVYAATPEKPGVPRTFPREGLATELGGSQVAAPAEGSFGQSDEEEDDE